MPSQGEQSSAKPAAPSPGYVLNPAPRSHPKVRHSASVLTALSKAPGSGQAGVFHSFLLALCLHRALMQLPLSPRHLCLPAELRVNLRLLWATANACKRGELR